MSKEIPRSINNALRIDKTISIDEGQETKKKLKTEKSELRITQSIHSPSIKCSPPKGVRKKSKQSRNRHCTNLRHIIAQTITITVSTFERKGDKYLEPKKSQKGQKEWPPDSPNYKLCESIQVRHKDEVSGFLEFLKEFKKRKRNTYSMMLVFLHTSKVFGSHLLELVLNFLPKDHSEGYEVLYLEWIEGSQRLMEKAKDSLKDWSAIRRLRKKVEEMLKKISLGKQTSESTFISLEKRGFVGREELEQRVDYSAGLQEYKLSLPLGSNGHAIKSTNQDTTDFRDCSAAVSLDISRLRCDEKGRNSSAQSYVSLRGMPFRMATNEDTTDLPFNSPSAVSLFSCDAMQKTSVQSDKRNNSSLRSSLNSEEKPRTAAIDSSQGARSYEAYNFALKTSSLPIINSNHPSIQRLDRINRDYTSILNGLTTGFGFGSIGETSSYERRTFASNSFIGDANNNSSVPNMREKADGFISY